MASIAIAKVSNGKTLTYHRMDDFYDQTAVSEKFQAIVNEYHAGETFEWCLEDVGTWETEIETNGHDMHAEVAIVDGSVQYG
jgi:hypothetical protein